MRDCNILVGAPGVGKSSWLASRYCGEVVISSDHIIEQIAICVGRDYNDVFTDVIKFADKIFWADLENAAERGANIVVDRTNMSAKSRKRILDVVRQYGYNFNAIVFPLPGTEDLSTVEWLRRLDSRPGKTIPLHVIESMLESFEMPTIEEGFDSIYSVGRKVIRR